MKYVKFLLCTTLLTSIPGAVLVLHVTCLFCKFVCNFFGVNLKLRFSSIIFFAVDRPSDRVREKN